MPEFLERKLKDEYAGQDPSIPYRIMNKMGAMHGNKITPRGRAMQAKHDAPLKRMQTGGIVAGQEPDPEDMLRPWYQPRQTQQAAPEADPQSMIRPWGPAAGPGVSSLSVPTPPEGSAPGTGVASESPTVQGVQNQQLNNPSVTEQPQSRQLASQQLRDPSVTVNPQQTQTVPDTEGLTDVIPMKPPQGPDNSAGAGIPSRRMPHAPGLAAAEKGVADTYNQKVPMWKKIAGGLLMGTGFGAVPGRALAGYDDKERADRLLKVQQEGMGMDIQTQTSDAAMQRAATAAAETPSKILKNVGQGQKALHDINKPSLRNVSEGQTVLDENTNQPVYQAPYTPKTTVSEKPIPGPNGTITAQPMTTTETRGTPPPAAPTIPPRMTDPTGQESTPAPAIPPRMAPPAAAPAAQAAPAAAPAGQYSVDIPMYAPGKRSDRPTDREQLAYLNNNPGNLEFANQPGATLGSDGRFARFETPEAGYQALINQVKLDQSRGLTLGQYVNKYLGKEGSPDKNNNTLYLQRAQQEFGANPNTPLSQIDTEKMAAFQARQDSSTNIQRLQAPTAPAAPRMGAAPPPTTGPGRVIGQQAENATTALIPHGLRPNDPTQRGEGLNLTGDKFVEALPLGTQALVQGVLSGAVTAPTAGSRTGGPLLEAAFRADPGFNAQRAQLRKEFAGEKNIGALNTAAVHMDRLYEAAEAMQNGTWQPGNRMYNYIATMFGSDKVTDYKFVMNALAGETATALKGNATDQEIAKVLENLGPNQAPQQYLGMAREGLKVLSDKLNTYTERLKAVDPTSKWSPILPSAARVFEKFGVVPGAPTPPLGAGAGKAPGQEKLQTTTTPDGKTWQKTATGWREVGKR